jgi:hypothetical protein
VGALVRGGSGGDAAGALSLEADIARLVAAGPIAEIARVGHAPFAGDDPIEITFANGAVFHIDVGFEGASDIRVSEGTLLDGAYGHLRTEEPATFVGIARDWTRETIDLPWVIGKTLSDPRRITMTEPYRLDVGYAFDLGGRRLALMGEADFIWAIALDDPEIADFGLEMA